MGLLVILYSCTYLFEPISSWVIFPDPLLIFPFPPFLLGLSNSALRAILDPVSPWCFSPLPLISGTKRVFLPLCSSLTKPPYGAIDNMGPMNRSSLFSTHYRYFRTHLVCWVLRQNVLSLGQRAEKESKNHQNLHCNKGDPRESPAMHPLFSLQNP